MTLDRPRSGSRTCCASSRRRSSARSSAATAASTRAEDAVQEALLAAATQWPGEGIPDNPSGWLIAVASRRMTDQLRADARPRAPRGDRGRAAPPDALHAPSPDDRRPDEDDTLTLLFLCCHPSLSPASQIALTLRAVGGLTTARDRPGVLRAGGDDGPADQPGEGRRSATAGAPFALPPADERAERLAVVLHVLYLIFNEGYTATSGPDLAPGRADRRGDPAGPRRSTGCCPTTAR